MSSQAVTTYNAEEGLLSRGFYSAQPLYFLDKPGLTANGQQWQVSSSLKQLGAQVGFQPSPEGIRDFLCYGFVPAPRTIFKGVSSVPPGMSCRLGFSDSKPDWQPHRVLQYPCNPLSADNFWSQLCKHGNHDQAALLLSGGLDSAMVAAAATATGAKIHAYHARFNGVRTTAGSDTHAARLTAKHLGLVYREININSLSALRCFHQVVAAMDQPFSDPVVLPFYLLFKAISQQHPQQVLTGEGGDQLFGSWSLKPMVMRALYPEENYCRDRAYLESFHKFPNEWRDLMANKLRQQLTDPEPVEQPIRQAFNTAPATDYCDQIRWVDLQLKGLQHILPRIAAMTYGEPVSLQHPFFKTDMIELGLQLPGELKFTGNQDKVLLKKLAADVLPHEIIHRRKQGMGVPTTQWFQRGLSPLAAYWLHKRRLEKSGLLNPQLVAAIRQQTLPANDARSRRWGDRLWMLCVLESWFASLANGV